MLLPPEVEVMLRYYEDIKNDSIERHKEQVEGKFTVSAFLRLSFPHVGILCQDGTAGWWLVRRNSS